MKRILLVCHETELSREIRLRLASLSADEGQENLVSLSDNLEDAQKHLKAEKPDLVVAHLHIPETLSDPVDEAAQHGIALLKWMHAQGIVVPGVLIAPDATSTAISRLSSVMSSIPGSRLVFEGPELGAQLGESAAEMLAADGAGANGAKPRSKILQIEVQLGRHTADRRYRVKGVGFCYRQDGPLNVDNHSLDRLAMLSDLIGSAQEKKWQEALHLIGEDLRKELFETRNSSFHADIADGLARAGLLLDGTELRFNVEREFYSVALEAILDPKTRNYWMLEAPIYRNLSGAGATVAPLFDSLDYDDGPVNCLVIDADAEGEVHGFGEDGEEAIALDRLQSVSRECEELATLLEENRKELGLGEIRLLRPDECDGPYWEHVQEVVEAGVTRGRNRGGWKLCHYGGHSYYDAARELGYIFFQNYADGDIQKVPLNEFSNWLVSTSFVYLSSCESSSADFVFQMAQHQVPAVLGFRWAISDDLAAEHAGHFYESLLEDRSLERAFLRTRQKMYRDHERHRIWAAPILIKQA